MNNLNNLYPERNYQDLKRLVPYLVKPTGNQIQAIQESTEPFL